MANYGRFLNQNGEVLKTLLLLHHFSYVLPGVVYGILHIADGCSKRFGNLDVAISAYAQYNNLVLQPWQASYNGLYLPCVAVAVATC